MRGGGGHWQLALWVWRTFNVIKPCSTLGNPQSTVNTCVAYLLSPVYLFREKIRLSIRFEQRDLIRKPYRAVTIIVHRTSRRGRWRVHNAAAAPLRKMVGEAPCYKGRRTKRGRQRGGASARNLFAKEGDSVWQNWFLDQVLFIETNHTYGKHPTSLENK